MADFLLDTNVLSELMREERDGKVIEWFERQQEAAFFISSVTCAEILVGIALLPAGKRRDRLAEAAEQMFEEDFSGRQLGFDAGCAAEYAALVAARTRQGRAVSTEDAQIASTALRHGLELVTRNTKDFANIAGLDVVNPWE